MGNAIFSPVDDDFHAAPPGDHWFTETSWFSFNIPERSMFSWIYGWARKNIPVTGGGMFVWDKSATTPWDIPYFKYQHAQPLPADADLRDFSFPEGYSVKVLEPLKRYHITYDDRQYVSLDMEFEGLFEPHGFTKGEPPFFDSGHLDQMGHITGDLVLRGEKIRLDCYSMRDRSWGTRQDHRGSRVGYPYGCAKDIGFCLFTVPHQNHDDLAEPVNHGFLWQDGHKAMLAPGGTRDVERDPRENWVTRMEIDATDVEGRPLKAIGTVESRFVLLHPRGICICSAVRWLVNGKEAYGEDQDVWRLDQWHSARRALAARG